MVKREIYQKGNVFENHLDRIGQTPLVKINQESSAIEMYMKLEGDNPTGSIKDRTALGIIYNQIARGNLTKGKTILDASSGSYACAISYIGNILGFPVTVVTGSKLTEDKKNFIKYFGAELISHGDYTIQGNDLCREMVNENPEKYCFLDQLHNWDNPDIHFNTTGPEILEFVPEVEAIVFSLGSGGTLNGISKYLKAQNSKVKIIGVTAASGTKIPGTGAFVDGDYVTPFIQELFDNDSLNYISEIAIDAAIEGVKCLRRKGFYVGIQTGGVYQGMLEAIEQLNIKGKVVMISGDSGWKNSDKLIKIDNV